MRCTMGWCLLHHNTLVGFFSFLAQSFLLYLLDFLFPSCRFQNIFFFFFSVFGKVFTLLCDIMCRLSTSRSKFMEPVLSSSSLLFHLLLYLPVALPDRLISTAVLYSLLSLNWNCALVFFFKIRGFDRSGSWYKTMFLMMHLSCQFH